MSATPGKVLVNGVTEIAGEKVFVLSLIQGRNPEWVGQTFFARYDEKAAWLSCLRPALGESRFFFEKELERLLTRRYIKALGLQLEPGVSLLESSR